MNLELLPDSMLVSADHIRHSDGVFVRLAATFEGGRWVLTDHGKNIPELVNLLSDVVPSPESKKRGRKAEVKGADESDDLDI